MKAQRTIYFRLIAVILVMVFAWQDVLFAAPDISDGRTPQSSLQIPLFFNTATDESIVEVSLRYLLDLIPDIASFKHNLSPDIAGVRIDLDFENSRQDGKILIVPCGYSERGSYRRRTVFIDLDDKSISFSKRSPISNTPIASENIIKEDPAKLDTLPDLMLPYTCEAGRRFFRRLDIKDPSSLWLGIFAGPYELLRTPFVWLHPIRFILDHERNTLWNLSWRVAGLGFIYMAMGYSGFYTYGYFTGAIAMPPPFAAIIAFAVACVANMTTHSLYNMGAHFAGAGMLMAKSGEGISHDQIRCIVKLKLITPERLKEILQALSFDRYIDRPIEEWPDELLSRLEKEPIFIRRVKEVIDAAYHLPKAYNTMQTFMLGSGMDKQYGRMTKESAWKALGTSISHYNYHYPRAEAIVTALVIKDFVAAKVAFRELRKILTSPKYRNRQKNIDALYELDSAYKTLFGEKVSLVEKDLVSAASATQVEFIVKNSYFTEEELTRIESDPDYVHISFKSMSMLKYAILGNHRDVIRMRDKIMRVCDICLPASDKTRAIFKRRNGFSDKGIGESVEVIGNSIGFAEAYIVKRYGIARRIVRAAILGDYAEAINQLMRLDKIYTTHGQQYRNDSTFIKCHKEVEFAIRWLSSKKVGVDVIAKEEDMVVPQEAEPVRIETVRHVQPKASDAVQAKPPEVIVMTPTSPPQTKEVTDQPCQSEPKAQTVIPAIKKTEPVSIKHPEADTKDIQMVINMLPQSKKFKRLSHLYERLVRAMASGDNAEERRLDRPLMDELSRINLTEEEQGLYNDTLAYAKLLRPGRAGLIGKYAPLEAVRFEYNPTLNKYEASFMAVNMVTMRQEYIVLYAHRAPPNTFLKFRRTAIPEIDHALQSFLGKSSVLQLILEINPYDIYGIGTKDNLAIIESLKDNDIALFHEVAHGAIDSGKITDHLLIANIKFGKKAFKEFLNLREKWHRRNSKYFEGIRTHYILRLFQAKMWPASDESLTARIKSLKMPEDIRVDAVNQPMRNDLIEAFDQIEAVSELLAEEPHRDYATICANKLIDCLNNIKKEELPLYIRDRLYSMLTDPAYIVHFGLKRRLALALEKVLYLEHSEEISRERITHMKAVRGMSREERERLFIKMRYEAAAAMARLQRLWFSNINSGKPRPFDSVIDDMLEMVWQGDELYLTVEQKVKFSLALAHLKSNYLVINHYTGGVPPDKANPYRLLKAFTGIEMTDGLKAVRHDQSSPFTVYFEFTGKEAYTDFLERDGNSEFTIRSKAIFNPLYTACFGSYFDKAIFDHEVQHAFYAAVAIRLGYKVEYADEDEATLDIELAFRDSLKERDYREAIKIIESMAVKLLHSLSDEFLAHHVAGESLSSDSKFFSYSAEFGMTDKNDGIVKRILDEIARSDIDAQLKWDIKDLVGDAVNKVKNSIRRCEYIAQALAILEDKGKGSALLHLLPLSKYDRIGRLYNVADIKSLLDRRDKNKLETAKTGEDGHIIWAYGLMALLNVGTSEADAFMLLSGSGNKLGAQEQTAIIRNIFSTRLMTESGGIVAECIEKILIDLFDVNPDLIEAAKKLRIAAIDRHRTHDTERAHIAASLVEPISALPKWIKELEAIDRPESLSRKFVEEVFSRFNKKKVVLAFDDQLGRAQVGVKALDVLMVINELKKDPKFSKLLQNIEIIKARPDAMSAKLEEYIQSGSEVFLFARANEEVRRNLGSLESKVHTAYIDESKLPIGSYYPLLEIVTAALSQISNPIPMNDLIRILLKMDIKPEEVGGVIIFTLLPSAVRHDTRELIRRYARLKELLINA